MLDLSNLVLFKGKCFYCKVMNIQQVIHGVYRSIEKEKEKKNISWKMFLEHQLAKVQSAVMVDILLLQYLDIQSMLLLYT